MERILMQVCVVSVGVFGLLAAFCATVWFWTKARSWSVLALPRVRLVVLAGGAIVATFAAQKGEIPDKPDDPPDNLFFAVSAGTIEDGLCEQIKNFKQKRKGTLNP